MKPGPEGPYFFVLPVRMDPVGQQNQDDVAGRIDPEGGTGIAEMADALPGEISTGGGISGGGGIKTEAPGGVGMASEGPGKCFSADCQGRRAALPSIKNGGA